LRSLVSADFNGNLITELSRRLKDALPNLARFGLEWFQYSRQKPAKYVSGAQLRAMITDCDLTFD
jgi:hypothetical protein